MENELFSILKAFSLDATVADIRPYGSGHIHDTYRVVTQHDGDYLLQKINHEVFQNVPRLMQNIETVTAHLHQRLARESDSESQHRSLQLISTTSRQPYYRDDNGNYWRMYRFIRKACTHDMAENPETVYEAGTAFGKFLALLADLPVDSLAETIPDFHNLENRLQTFWQVVEQNPAHRVENAAPEIEAVTRRADEMLEWHRLAKAGNIPQRITHNDTKLNNVLFDESGRALCVVDLDTVMPGYVHYDFGDAIRTCANTGAEDEADLSKVELNLNHFRAFAQGYLQETATILTPPEIDTLAFSAKFMTYLIGLRFLTDYLAGDGYFKIRFAEHNLHRARAQFKLLASMEERFAEMQKIIAIAMKPQI